MGIKGTSDRQLTEIIRRRSLKDDDPDFIPRALMDRFLDGHLINEDPSQLARVVDVSAQVSAMTNIMGMHEHAVWPDGSTRQGEDAYRALWPKVVHVPLLMEFEHVGLIDSTVPIGPLQTVQKRVLIENEPGSESLRWPDCQDAARDDTGARLNRYIIFTKFSSNDGVRTRLDDDSFFMDLREAVHLVGQSGTRFLNDGFFVLAQEVPIAAWMRMGWNGASLTAVNVWLSQFDENHSFTHNVLVRHQNIIPVD